MNMTKKTDKTASNITSSILSLFTFSKLKNVSLPTVSYECENWSFILKAEYTFRIIEDRVLREVFGPKGGEVTVEWGIILYKRLRVVLLFFSSVFNDSGRKKCGYWSEYRQGDEFLCISY